MESFLQRFLKVIPLDSPIKFENFPSYRPWTSYEEGLTSNDVDFYTGIFLRPATGYIFKHQPHVTQFDKTYKRPTQGNIIVFQSSSNIKEAQSEETKENDVFYDLLSQVIIQLGFHNYAIQYFHPYENGTAYNTTMCKLTRFNRTYNILVTPYAHKYAVKHYGVETFEGDNSTSETVLGWKEVQSDQFSI